jgi:methylated-DNA-protein-cysteine methyltransferase related protein
MPKPAAKRDSMFTRIADTIRRVPKGKVSTYGDIAYAAGFPGAARQVAWALHQSKGLPWQRIVGAEGKILLPADRGFEQRMRLRQEGVNFIGLKVDMKQHQAKLSELRRKSAKGTAASVKRSGSKSKKRAAGA